MNISSKRKLLIAQFDKNFELLEKSVKALSYSFDKCAGIEGQEDYDLEEQESFEALTSRFARTSDILTQKVFKTLLMLLQENPRTFIDTANLLTKLEIIEEADDLLNIREIRNQIAHEYVEPDIKTLFSDVLQYVPGLMAVIDNVKAFYSKNFNSV